MKTFVGLDVSQKKTSICVIDHNGNKIRMANLFMSGKRLIAGVRITTSAVHIFRLITRLQLNFQRTGETENMKKNQPTFLIEGCI